MFKKENATLFLRGAAYLFVSEGAFAFCSDVLTLSHHHEVLRPPLLLVAGAGMRVQFGSLLHKFLPVAPSRLEQSQSNDIKPVWLRQIKRSSQIEKITNCGNNSDCKCHRYCYFPLTLPSFRFFGRTFPLSPCSWFTWMT